MSARVPLVLAAASFVVLLAGCSAHEPPPSLSDAEREVYFEKRLDVAWINTGLDGKFERPVIAGKVVDRFDESSWESFNSCVSELGLSSWGSIEKDGGPQFIDGTGGALIPDVRLAVYRCFAEFPQAENQTRVMLTEAQKEYLYEYYSRWTVPCLRSNDYNLVFLPTRQEFLGIGFNWNPYYSLEEGFDSEQYAALVELCGNPYADLDVDGSQLF